LLVAFFGSSGAFETLAAEPLSTASPVTGGASGVAIVVASGETALAETCEFSVAPLSLTAETAYAQKYESGWRNRFIYQETIRHAVRYLGLLSLDRLRSLRSSWTQPERLVAH